MLDNQNIKTAPVVLYRTYSRLKEDGTREHESEIFDRAKKGIVELGNFNQEIKELIERYIDDRILFPSGRWLWVGGTEFIKKAKNFYAAYNCASIHIQDLNDFAHNFSWLMMGCGVGAVLEKENLQKLPSVVNNIEFEVIPSFSDLEKFKAFESSENTFTKEVGETLTVQVGDSREGWVDTYLKILQIWTSKNYDLIKKVIVDLRGVRPAGQPIKGFGGTSNPSDLSNLFLEMMRILNEYASQKKPWDSFLASWLLNRAAKCTVAG